MAINMDDVDHAYATTEAAAAIADGLISSNAQGTYMTYAATQPNANPLYVDLVASGRFDFIPADTFVDRLNELADPRRSKYFTEYPAGSGLYKGGEYGAINVYDNFSHLTTTIQDPTYPGVLFTYSEVQFLLAEAVERGLTTGDASTYYNAGITASMQDWGVASADISAYLATVPYASATWKQKIGEQSWIALYNRGFEAWTVYRRLDYPALQVPTITYGDITSVPKRYSYPNREQTLNAASLEAAVAKLGNNAITSKVFWDKF